MRDAHQHKDIYLIVNGLTFAIDELFLSIDKLGELDLRFLDLTFLEKIKKENEVLIDKVFSVDAVDASAEQRIKMNKKVIELRARISMLIDEKNNLDK